jgi:predicted phage tail protein
VLPPDRYKVKVTAQYKITDSQRLQNKVSLTGVKASINGYNGLQSYGDSTLLAVRIKATNGIATQSQNQLRVRAKRRITKLDGTVGTTSNPADIAHDILTNTDYGASQSDRTTGTDVFLDHANFTDCHGLWEGYKTDPTNYPAFNGSFATANTVWDALQSALSVAVTKPLMHHGQVRLSRDALKPTRSFMFNSNNIVLDSLTANYSLSSENEEDHVEVEYRNDDLMEPAYAIYPKTLSGGGTPRSPFKVKLFGCTNGAYAAKYARLVYNRRLYQRKSVSFDTEMDGMLPMVGDRILVSSPQVRWGVSGSVRFAKKNSGGNWVLTLDAIPDWDARAAAGVHAYVVLTDKEGKVSTRARFLPTSAKDEHIILQSEPTYQDGVTPFEIDISGARDPARFAVLLSSGENGRDMEITSIEHRGGTEFGINAVHYEVNQNNGNHRMYDGVPEHMKKAFDGSDLI